MTLAFVVVMALVFAGLGVFLYSSHKTQLTDTIDQGLRSRAGEVAALIRDSPRALRNSASSLVIERDESFTQLIDESGRVLDSTPQLRGQVLLSPLEVTHASRRLRFFVHSSLAGVDGNARLLATPIEVRGRKLIAVVGVSLGDRGEALANLKKLLILGGLAALVLSSLVGVLAVTAALRPVEAMRRRATEISSGGPDERLPVSPSGDQLARLGETLNAMLARLQEGLERERRFVDDASHELRTPLALHKTELELALRYGRGEAELRAAIASATEEVDRLIGLSESLLLVARSGEGEITVEEETLRSDELIQGVSRRFAARAGQLGRRLVTGGGSIPLLGDRVRLEQALTGMVDNALRHGDGDVGIFAARNGGSVALHVTDQGLGFEDGFEMRAFERFSRADTARARGGVGLGLAIVDGIARAHGGRAIAGNMPDGGADVWIVVPDDSRAGG